MRAETTPMISRHAAAARSCMLPCIEDGGARLVFHEFAWFLGMPCGSMIMLDDYGRSEQRNRSHTPVESVNSERWSHRKIRGEQGVCMRWSCSECVHGNVYNVTIQC